MSKQRVFKRNVLALSVAAANVLGAAVALPAFAQSSESESGQVLEEIVVTGYRQSLKQSLDMKRDAVGAVDAIVAEDIAKFPDLNLAESLQRIPGVSIRREAGEGRNITVRGLGPQFTRVRVNGMEGLSTGGGTDSSGGVNRDRQFDFNIFASELFNSIVVRKTQEAWVDEGSLGATVDLRTARPFDYDGQAAALNMQGLYNDLVEEVDPRVAGLYSNIFADGKLGVLIAGAYTEREIYEEGASTVRWQNADWGSCSGCSSPGEVAAVNDSFHPRIPRYGRLTHDQERIGINGAIQWRPSDRTEIVFEGMYGTLEGTRQEQFLEALIRNEEDVMDVADYTLNGNVMTAGTFNNTFVRIENRLDELETKFTQYVLSGSHYFSDDLRMDAMFGTADSEFENPQQTTIIFDNFTDGYSYDYSDPDLPRLDYGFDVTDASQFEYTEFRDRPNFVDNSFDNFKLDFDWTVNNWLTMKAGGSFKKYTFDVAEGRRDGRVADVLGANVPVTPELADMLKGFGSGLDMPGGNDKAWVVPNIDAGAALVDLYNIEATPRDGDIRSVEEETTAYYVQADFEVPVGNMNLRANAGLRYYDTELASTGILSGSTVTVDTEYDDILPAINTALEISDTFVVRASWAQVMARPGLSNLTPGGSIGVFGEPTLSFGNPELEPFQADAYDLSAEWYFMDEGLFSVGYFYKDIDSFVARVSEDGIPFSSLGLPCSLLDASPIQGECDTPFRVTRNENGNGGELSGVELIFQMPFTFLPGILANTGFAGNYTYVDSEVDYAAPGEPKDLGPLVQTSENNYNATLYYEDDKFAARMSVNYRDDFLIDFPDEVVEEATQVDFSSSYNWNENLQLTFEVINITDEFFDQRHLAGGNSLSYVYHHTGRNYFLGFRWKL
ncbi:TonB-dependent receptor [Parahaliea aestuarii]|uniref:TonB-dependent receptor n=1 Tax=Parahaliea aestuarii TaxID=1852021 RepID=A0A5C8ZV78_9GAMM|nr:TonB-dependent receptor [Parahaliea aestuarii]TXS91729.1 TonB-dependent receptor [Parahaliea aestuarii]